MKYKKVKQEKEKRKNFYSPRREEQSRCHRKNPIQLKSSCHSLLRERKKEKEEGRKKRERRREKKKERMVSARVTHNKMSE